MRFALVGMVIGASAAVAAPSASQDLARLYARAEEGNDAHAAYQLAQALEAEGYPFLASAYDAQVVKAGAGAPDRLAAVQQLVQLQERLDDEYLLPSLIASQDQSGWSALPPQVKARADFLTAGVELRRGQLASARARLQAIPQDLPVAPEASYLLGVVLSDPRFPGGARNEEALRAFERVLRVDPGGNRRLERTRQLAQLATARTLYALGRYPEAVKAYEAIPRYGHYWPDALFEDGFARFRAGDPGGALGTLQALHAPQFEGAFQPESWILQATVYYFNCLYDEARTALYAFDQAYTPMMNALRPFATGALTPAEAYAQIAQPAQSKLPRPVLLWARNNERMLRVFALLEQIRAEVQKLGGDGSIRGTPADAGLRQTLDDNRQTVEKVAGQLAKNRIVEAYRNLKGFADQAEILRFESTKAEKELIERGIDRKKVLAADRLYPPESPGPNVEAWRFEGEFWADELGYYRYTLKNACVNTGSPAPGK